MPPSRLIDIAGETAAALEALGCFRNITIAPVSSGAQLFDTLEAMTRFPAALIAIAGADYAEEGLERNLRLLIVVADRYRRSGADKAAGIWELVEKVQDLAIGKGLAPCGIPVTPVNFDPLDSGDENITAFAFTLEGAEA